MGWTPSKARLLEKLNDEHQALLQLIDLLTTEQLQAPVLPDGWSVKDVLAHLSAWDKRGTRWIQQAAQGQIPQIPEPGCTWADTDRLNAATFQANQSRSFTHVKQVYDRSFQGLVSVIEQLPAETVHKRIQLAPNGRTYPLFNLIMWRYLHIRGHSQPIRAWLRSRKEPGRRAGGPSANSGPSRPGKR